MPTVPTPPRLLDRALLQEKAVESCRKHVEQVLQGEYLIDPLEADLQWDPIFLRHVFEQPMLVWRVYAGYEILLDDHDQPVGFVDEDKWLFCSWRELPPGQAEALARGTGFVPQAAELAESKRGEKDCLELVFASKGPVASRIRVRINPRRRTVISAEPEGTAP